MLQLQIECGRDEAEALSALLEKTGALSITFTDKQDDPILEPELGTTPFWPNVVIQALYTKLKEAEEAVEYLSLHATHLNSSIHSVVEQDWQRVWMNGFKPMRFGQRLWICPSWSTPPDALGANLILDPGLAFGTGSHPTTSLCLSWLDDASLRDQKLIDYGCGSGILALAAIKLGAAHVHAVDIDEQALLASRDNANRNTITDAQLSVSLPDELQQKTELLIANILLSPLIALKERFSQLLEKQGTLVVSGILTEQAPLLIAEYEGTFIHKKTVTKEEWVLLEFTAI